MAMNAANLKTELVALLGGNFTEGNEHCVINDLATAIANAVVAHISANGEISTSGVHVWSSDGSHVHGPGTIS